MPGGCATRVIGGGYITGIRPVGVDFVAWPNRGFTPVQTLPGSRRWSLGVGGADFTGATVTMMQNGRQAPVTVVHRNECRGHGDHTLVGEIVDFGLAPEQPDVRFDVTVANVRVGGVSKTYTYPVTVIDADPTG